MGRQETFWPDSCGAAKTIAHAFVAGKKVRYNLANNYTLAVLDSLHPSRPNCSLLLWFPD